MSIFSDTDICYSKRPAIYKNINKVLNIKTFVFAGNDREKNLICIKVYQPADKNTEIPEIYLYEPKLIKFLQGKSPAFPIFFGSFTEKGRLSIVVEYIEHTLESKIMTWKKNSIKLQKIDVLIIMKILVEGMKTLKSFGIYHNCINPSNILINSRISKIIDFSNVRINYESSIGEYLDLCNLPSYLPPEVISQSGPPYIYDAEKSDVFALGLCFLEIITLQDISGLNQPENKEKLENIIESLEESTIKDIIKLMLDPIQENRATWDQIFELFSIKKVKYPIGTIQSLQDIKFTIEICKFNNGMSEYFAMIGEEKVVVRFYNTTNVEQLDFSDYHVSSLSAVSGQLDCFLRLLGAFEEEGRLWVVHENYGESVESIINNRTVLSIKFQETELKSYFFQLLKGLEYCFNHKVYHNNIQPSTIFILNQTTLKFNSFGPPYYSKRNSGFMSINACRLKIEPFDYYPPEIYKGDLESGATYEKPKADIYALGLVFYEMVTLRRITLPNYGEIAETIFGYLNEIDVRWIQQLLQGMLAPLPSDRLEIDELLSLIPKQ